MSVTVALILNFIFADAQNKMNVDVSFGLRQSFSNNILKEYKPDTGSVSLRYFSRQRFERPYFNFLASVTYEVLKNLNIGLQTGIYVHYGEKYWTNIRRTTLTAPLQLTTNYTMLTFNKNALGVNASYGILFFSLQEYVFKYKNSSLGNISVFFKSKNGGLLKIGFEKQADFVSVDLKGISQYAAEEMFKYSVKRLAVAVSYGVVIK